MPNDTKLSSLPERRDRGTVCAMWCFWQQATATNKMSRVPARLKIHHFLFATLRYAAKANDSRSNPPSHLVHIDEFYHRFNSAQWQLSGELVTWMGALAAQGCECGSQGQSSESTGDDPQTAAFPPLSHSCSCTKHEAWIFSCTHSLVWGLWCCTPCGNLHEWYKNNRNNEILLCTGGDPLPILPSSAAFEFPSQCPNTFLLLSLSGSVLHSSFVN